MSKGRTNAERQRRYIARLKKRAQAGSDRGSGKALEAERARRQAAEARVRELEVKIERLKAKARRAAHSDSDELPEPRRQALAELPKDGFVTVATVMQFLNVSRKTLTGMIARGYFPPPDMLIGGRWPRWSVHTLHRFANKPPKTMPPLRTKTPRSKA